MEVLSLVKLTKGRAKICLAGGTDFVLYKKEYESYGIEEGADLSEADYNQIVTDILIPRCKKRALHLLEKQDRSEKNLRDKLKEGGYSQEIVDIAIDYINEYGYLDDARMAASHIRFYQDSRSKLRLKQDLIGKGISADVIDRVMDEEYTSDESDLIEKLLLKKNYDKDNATYEERAKMYRFLAGRGFSSDSINRVLK
ncbi:MAG: regulatory protein RecX [Pseudobutyrivibrio ruminis]|uniref:Regulatory protein RecX n=1 Tax=Pseudobutyrivibrio ruminis TaxID=46206 RepID=A0A927YN85_9FIRM|nr:regulatory protein RecX [Pseudobutyrivibrio sp.]MBE5920594.1 regulatory protein RecX [Pseudobutyrivibrio ruminis]MBP3728340.1 regulatory protein RecX [Pseudobutyrivibrio sp.]MBQ6462167.1 regulatory protein RecX [Pseudobutyrivibrio sp.]